MIDFLITFKDQLILIVQYIAPTFLIAFMSLGVVSIAGRLLEICYTDHSKNILAFFSITIFSFLYQKTFDLTKINFNIIWNILELITMTTIIYISFCWRFYSRIDSFLDRWLGEDKKFKPTVKKKRK